MLVQLRHAGCEPVKDCYSAILSRLVKYVAANARAQPSQRIGHMPLETRFREMGVLVQEERVAAIFKKLGSNNIPVNPKEFEVPPIEIRSSTLFNAEQGKGLGFGAFATRTLKAGSIVAYYCGDFHLLKDLENGTVPAEQVDRGLTLRDQRFAGIAIVAAKDPEAPWAKAGYINDPTGTRFDREPNCTIEENTELLVSHSLMHPLTDTHPHSIDHSLAQCHWITHSLTHSDSLDHSLTHFAIVACRIKTRSSQRRSTSWSTFGPIGKSPRARNCSWSTARRSTSPGKKRVHEALEPVSEPRPAKRWTMHNRRPRTWRRRTTIAFCPRTSTRRLSTVLRSRPSWLLSL